MATRIIPLKPGESPDMEVNAILEQGRDSWWKDTAMFGVIGRRPGLLKSIVPVFVSFFVDGQVPAHIHEMMRIKTGQINDCTY